MQSAGVPFTAVGFETFHHLHAVILQWSLDRYRMPHSRLFEIGSKDHHLTKLLSHFGQGSQTRTEDTVIIADQDPLFIHSYFSLLILFLYLVYRWIINIG